MVLAGCVSRPAESPHYRDVLPQEAVALDHHEATYLPPKTGQGDEVEDILALSGGGAYGAYGVGFLEAWTERGDRPQFDIVTGVSTGALMSVYAFLGPQYDRRMREIYTKTSDKDIYTER